MTLRTERPDVGDQPVILDTTGETSPYPFFEYMRRTDPVFHGSLMDTRPAAAGAETGRRMGAVRLRRRLPGLPRRQSLHLRRVRQDDRVGDGPHHPGDGRQGASRPSQLGGQGIPGHRARTLGAIGHRAGLRSADRRDQERRPRRPGEGADVRIPDPDHLRTARTPPRRSRHVPATVTRPHLDPDRHRWRG